MKEFPNGSKNKWTRIFKKKWFFPALYIVLAAFLLSAVVWYQNVQSKMFEGIDELEETNQQEGNSQSGKYNEEAESVVSQAETIEMPVDKEAQAEIVTTFYDYTADEDEQEKGLTFYNNRYYQSTGVDIAADDGESFEVMASLSGTVTEVKQDPLHGNVVVLDHGDDIATYYASMEDIEVKEEDEVEQGDKLGSAGNNLFGEESGTHVHFEISKEDTAVNPEKFFNQSLENLVESDVEQATESNMMQGSEEMEEDAEGEEGMDEDGESNEGDVNDAEEEWNPDADEEEIPGGNENEAPDVDENEDLNDDNGNNENDMNNEDSNAEDEAASQDVSFSIPV